MIYAVITIATFFGMEFMAWFTHKFVMHGFMWYFHEDHHVPQKGFFEKNDVFFLIYAAPSATLMMLGALNNYDFRFFIGLGILFYGIAYFLVHDVLIHQRFDWFKRTDNIYFRAIRKAHKVHHKHQGKEEGECFGMLLVPMKYFREAIKYKENKTRTA
ncbi:MAG: sterol desaturase family protein [Flavobacteriales bacterium]